jgi:hypothetical protein
MTLFSVSKDSSALGRHFRPILGKTKSTCDLTDLTARLERWAEELCASFRLIERNLLFEAADEIRSLTAELNALRADRAESMQVMLRGLAEACDEARAAGRAEGLEDAAAACDEAAREYQSRAQASIPGMSFGREWDLCADTACACAESVRGLLPRADLQRVSTNKCA